MSLFAVYYGFFETAPEDHDLVTVFEDLESAVEWVNDTVLLDGLPVYGLYVVEFGSGESPESGKVVYEIAGEAA